jgi:hypothetical protein
MTAGGVPLGTCIQLGKVFRPPPELEPIGPLIYTATAGAQGMLAGLVGTAPRFAQILEGA